MKYKILVLSCILQLIALSTLAQNDLAIKNVFDKYGKQEGSVLVQLSSDVLSQGSKITFYKSLIMDGNSIKEQDASGALKADIGNNIIISEIKKNGKVESGTYSVGNKNGNNRYILYKNKSDKITIVYLEGKFSANKLDSELKKLKDLFIYVNNKRIKLQ